MSPGRGNLIGSLALALGALGLAVPGGAASEPSAGAWTSVQTAAPAGARAAELTNVLNITGASIANRFNVYPTVEGGLGISSPEGIVAPPTPNGECVQHSSTLISCAAGYIDVIAGHLGAGDDTVTTGANLPIQIGAQLGSQRHLLSAGNGNDRLVGGAAGDAITGNAGLDTVIGGRGADALFGGAGKDNLIGGASSDALFGSGGPDRLNGGSGRDLCDGGQAKDSGRSCEVPKKIP